MIEGNSTPEETGYKEIEDETGISREDARLVRMGTPIQITTEDSEVVVTPILLDVERTEIRLNWEHTEYEWIKPKELSKFQTVPRFDELLKALGLI